MSKGDYPSPDTLHQCDALIFMTPNISVDRRKTVSNAPILRRPLSCFNPINPLLAQGTLNALTKPRFACKDQIGRFDVKRVPLGPESHCRKIILGAPLETGHVFARPETDQIYPCNASMAFGFDATILRSALAGPVG